MGIPQYTGLRTQVPREVEGFRLYLTYALPQKDTFTFFQRIVFLWLVV